MTDRIRWHAPAESTVVAEFGYVGTLTGSLFQILKPVTREVSPSRFDEWGLVATFPGAQREVLYASSRDKTEAVAELRAEAERWLERFVASLGAAFPPEPYDFGEFNEAIFRAQYEPGRRVRYATPATATRQTRRWRPGS
jgi:hypothetical protein